MQECNSIGQTLGRYNTGCYALLEVDTHYYEGGGRNMNYVALLHAHVSSWSLGLLLFIAAVLLLWAGKAKGLKITHMILRLFYILILVTGVGLLFTVQFPLTHILKGIFAFWLIYVMEMILVRGAKGKLTPSMKKSFTFQWIVAVVLIFLLGYRVIVF
jgi:hypothetical protein